MLANSSRFSYSTLPVGQSTRVRQTVVYSPAITPLTENGVWYKTAEHKSEHEGAFRLAYKAYVKSGLMEPNTVQLRVTRHLLLPTTVTFVALRALKVVATVSMIRDEYLGLPLECVYGKEVDDLRSAGIQLGEVSALASSCDESEADTGVVIALMRLMAQFSWRHGVERLLIAVHPKHARLYRRCLGFRVFGAEKCYPAVRDRPAVALQLDLSRLEQDFPSIHKFFFGDRIADEHLRASPMAESVRLHFETMAMEELDLKVASA